MGNSRPHSMKLEGAMLSLRRAIGRLGIFRRYIRLEWTFCAQEVVEAICRRTW